MQTPSQTIVVTTILMCLAGSAASSNASTQLSLRPAGTPPAEKLQAMRQWDRGYRLVMDPVKRQWSRVAAAIRGRNTEVLTVSCKSFRERLAAVDQGELLSAPDAAVNLHLALALDHLEAAADRCRPERRFDLAFRLGEARRALLEVEGRLCRYRKTK